MRQFLLASALIALPVAGFGVFEALVPPPAPATAAVQADPLGDLSSYRTIVADTRALAEAGDLAAAETRITDLETRWDEAEATLRPKDPEAWGNVDAAADDAFAALRAPHPEAAAVERTLGALSLVLSDPSAAGAAATGTVGQVAGVAVTDEIGHAIPCETLLAHLRRALDDGSIAESDKAEATALQAKATERCNADDDRRADAFAAQVLSLAGH